MNLSKSAYIGTIFLALTLGNLANATQPDTTIVELDFLTNAKSPAYFISRKKHVRPRIGLALSGGGARAVSQIGVIQVLEEHAIPIDCIVGTSMGSVIGGLYAAGYSTEEILKHLKGTRWENIIRDSPPREDLFLGQKQDQERYILQLRFSSFKPYIPAGLTPGQKISSELTALIMHAPFGSLVNFDDLRIPFRAVATDLISGEKILLDHGNLADAMCASMAFPLLFSPVEWDSLLLVDGGMINNIPVEDVRAMGMDVVIAVDATSPLRKPNQIALPWEIVDQATTIMQRLKNDSQKTIADFYFHFEIPDHLSSDFTELDTLVNLGRRETLKQIDQIKNYLQKKDFEYYVAQNSFFKEKCRIDSVQFEGFLVLSPSTIKATLDLDSFKHHPVNCYQIHDLLSQIYSLGYFSNVRCLLIHNVSVTQCVIQVEENPMINRIIFSGNSVFPDSTLYSHFKSVLNKVLNHRESQKSVLKLLAHYRSQGYPLAQIQSIFLEPKGILLLHIEEGKIAKINIEGNETTQEYVILRELPLKTGHIFNYETVQQGIQNIYSTGLFNTVRLNILQNGSYPELTIKVNEKKFNLVRIGGRYDSERKGRGFIEFLNQNLFGTGNSLTFHLQSGDRDRKSSVQFRADRIFKTYLTTKVDLFYQDQKYFSFLNTKRSGEYSEARTGIDISLGQQIQRFGTVSVESRYNHINLDGLWGLNSMQGEIEVNTIALR